MDGGGGWPLAPIQTPHPHPRPHPHPHPRTLTPARARPGRQECLAWMAAGARNRATSATAMNERSSRSHALLSLYVSASAADASSAAGPGPGPGGDRLVLSRLNIIDLAGSEVCVCVCARAQLPAAQRPGG